MRKNQLKEVIKFMDLNNSNQKVSGRAIFSDKNQVKNRSLRIYTYLVCHSYLRNQPNVFGDNVRIFTQRDINMAQMSRILKMDHRTIKKYWNELENSALINFRPHGWKEDLDASFEERWKIRNKHKDTYYEIPAPPLFRKIPKETLVELVEIQQVKELTLKIYMTLINYQEDCIANHLTYKRFTYQDLQDILGYAQETAFDRKAEAAINQLDSLGLLDYELGECTNSRGVKIPVYVVNAVNFYINYKNKDFVTAAEPIISEEQTKRIKEENSNFYPEVFNQ